MSMSLNHPVIRLALALAIAVAGLNQRSLPGPTNAASAAVGALGTATPLPLNCPGSSTDSLCAIGYVYDNDAPVAGASVKIDSPFGSVTVATTSGPLSPSPYYQVDLQAAPLLASTGITLTIEATYQGRLAATAHVPTTGGQQVDVVIVPTFDDWWNDSYAFRRPLPIVTGSALAAGTLIKVEGVDLETLVGQGRMRADHNDLRIARRISANNWEEVARVYFTGQDVEFRLSATINAGTDNSYYLYYGNPSAGSPPTFTLPQGWWADIYDDKNWTSFRGTWAFDVALNLDNVCSAPLDHDGKTGSGFDESDRFRGRLYIPYDGAWTFRVYTNDGYGVLIDGVNVGQSYAGSGERWVTVGSASLTAGWHRMELLHNWVGCGPWRFAMSGPSFTEQIVPANYFQQVWDGLVTGITPGSEEARVVTLPPVATFQALLPGNTALTTDAIRLRGAGVIQNQLATGITQIVWRSDLDGILGSTADLTLPAGTLRAGTHTIFFKVRDSQFAWSAEISRPITISAAATPAPTSPPTGSHHVRLPMLARTGGACYAGSAELEPNNTTGQATGPLCRGLSYQGFVNDSDDFYAFDAAQGGAIVVSLANPSGAGVQLVLYAGSSPVAQDVSAPYQINHTASLAGRYYARVYAVGGFNATTPYTIQVNYP